jgi:hypothetical protein
MFKGLKYAKDMALRIVFVMKMFWSFGFVSLYTLIQDGISRECSGEFTLPS